MSAPLRLLHITGWRGRGLCAALGAAAVLGQAPFHIWPITIGALALLLARLKAVQSTRAGFGTAFWFALGYFLVGTYWIGSAFIARGPQFIPLMVPMVAGLGGVLALFWGAAGAFFVRARLQGAAAALGFVSLFFLAEFSRGHLFGGFPWNLLGYVFDAGRPISQTASLIGVYGLTMIVLILAACLEPVISGAGRLKGSLAGLAIAGLLYGGGTWRIKTSPSESVANVILRIVQVRFSQRDKLDQQKAINIVNEFLTQSVSPGIEAVTHVVWPEGAINGVALDNEAFISVMGSELTRRDLTPPIWLLNSLRHEQRPNPYDGSVIDDYYNSSAALSFDAQGIATLAAYNDKQKLVPFGEFIPGGKLMEARNVPVISTSLLSISAAKTKGLSIFPGLPKLSPQICYEIIFSGFTPHPKGEPRAEWILNQSNDAWYGDSIGPRQHANMAAYRAIEEGVPVVRAASNGLSGVINPLGHYIISAGPKETGVIDARLPKPFKPTFFGRRINILLALINLLISLCCCTLLRSGHR